MKRGIRIVCGADGCRGGWIRVIKDLDTGAISWRLCAMAHELASAEPVPDLIGVDIPMGLPERGPRLCDLEARRLLGRGRGSSIFPAPIRPILTAASYEEACRIRVGIEGKRLSRQSWGIIPKIREMDELLRRDPILRERVREVHPEVSFFFMAGQRALRYGKKTPMGREERCRLLEPHFGPWPATALREPIGPGIGADDILDAFAALWTAERMARGTAEMLPPTPPRDRFGLPMEIIA